MQALETIKNKSQENLNRLVDLGKSQPPHVQTWGVTAAAAVAGALALAATAQGLVAILATLAAPPVALTIGAIGGGLAGWSYIQGSKDANAAPQSTPAADPAVTPIVLPNEPIRAEPSPVN